MYGFTPGAASTPGADIISGTISAKPPMLTVSTIRTPSRPLAFSTDFVFHAALQRLEPGAAAIRLPSSAVFHTL